MTLNEFLKEVNAQESDIISYTEEEAIRKVKENGYLLQYVRKQTPEICMAAVKENGYLLQYVREQTPEICMAAVKQNGVALHYVDKSIFETFK